MFFENVACLLTLEPVQAEYVHKSTRKKQHRKGNVMAEVVKTKRVKANGWRTLEWGVNASFHIRFFLPRGATVKVRKGLGWFGWDSQKTTLNGQNPVILHVSGIVPSRVQIYVRTDADVTYTYIAA